MPERTESDEDLVGARSFWSGTITFGLVSVPVALMPATRSSGVSLRMVSPEGTPLTRRYFAPRDNRPLDWEDIVRGYELEKDKFVVVEDEELERIAPERTRDIDLRVFVPASQIDPVHFERAYYLLPAGDSTKAYRLLARVMEETDRAGIATFVMRGKEYLVAILAQNGVLRAETLRFQEEVRTPDDVGLPPTREGESRLVRKFENEIKKLTKRNFALTELTDPTAERLRSLAEKKLKEGKDVVRVEEEPEESPDVIDLMELLQRSLQGDGSDTGGGSSRKKPKKKSRAKSVSRDDDLEASSRTELYEKAKKLDIPGRSSMSKEELIEAIRRSA